MTTAITAGITDDVNLVGYDFESEPEEFVTAVRADLLRVGDRFTQSYPVHSTDDTGDTGTRLVEVTSVRSGVIAYLGKARPVRYITGTQINGKAAGRKVAFTSVPSTRWTVRRYL